MWWFRSGLSRSRQASKRTCNVFFLPNVIIKHMFLFLQRVHCKLYCLGLAKRIKKNVDSLPSPHGLSIQTMIDSATGVLQSTNQMHWSLHQFTGIMDLAVRIGSWRMLENHKSFEKQTVDSVHPNDQSCTRSAQTVTWPETEWRQHFAGPRVLANVKPSLNNIKKRPEKNCKQVLQILWLASGPCFPSTSVLHILQRLRTRSTMQKICNIILAQDTAFN